MKTFINQVGRLRSQQGAVRFVVVCSLLAALTLVVFGMGYSKFIVRAHAMPIAHTSTASKGCGCSILDAKDVEDAKVEPNSPVVGYWSPPAKSFSREEVAALPTVLLLKAGGSLPVKSLVWDHKLGPKSVWTAMYGTVNAAGNYLAPPYTPSRGDDVITLSDPSNVFINGTQIRVHILPNSIIAGSAGTPYIKYTPAGTTTGSDSHVYYSHKLILPPGMDSLSPEFQKNITPVFSLEDMPAPSAPVTQVAVDGTTSVSGQFAYSIPATDSFGRSLSGLFLPASSTSPLMVAKELPLYAGNSQTNPDPRFDDTGNAIVNDDGNLNNAPDPATKKEAEHCKSKAIHLHSLGSTVTTTASIVTLTTLSSSQTVDIAKILHLGLTEATPITATAVIYTKTTTWDMYQCQKGKKTKIGQKSCINHTTVYQDASPPFADSVFKHIKKYSSNPVFAPLLSVVPLHYGGQPVYDPSTASCSYSYT